MPGVVGRCALMLGSLWVCAFAGCTCGPGTSSVSHPGPDGGGSPGGGAGLELLDGLQVTPASAVAVIRNGVPATAQFRALGTRAGASVDVTDQVTWAVDGAPLATVSGPGRISSTTAHGGTVAVRATGGGASASALLRLRVEFVTLVDDAQAPLPANAAERFSGPAEAARAPQLVYPNDGVLVPPNLGRLEVHYRRGQSANTLFEVSFRNALTDVRIVTRCVPLADGCLFEVTGPLWERLGATNAGGEPLELRVRGTDELGSAVGSSAVQKLSVTPDAVAGALYYWTTTSPVQILRWDFGSTSQRVPEKVVGPESGDGRCLGCHALSRDGSKLVATMGDANVGQLLLWDVARRAPAQPFPLTGRSWFESWDPGGAQFVGVNGAAGERDLVLFDGVTGARTGSIALGGLQAAHPDWSADGALIAFTAAGQFAADTTVGQGAIATVRRGPSGWEAPRVLVPSVAGRNRYYPAIAPDVSMVAFDESTCAAGATFGPECDADADPTASLQAVSLTPGGAPLRLEQADRGGVADPAGAPLMNSFPKWSPFSSPGLEGGQLLWLTFSSRRRYGLRAPPPGGRDGQGGMLMWMTAIDPARLARGEDPSAPAFCLPFQDLGTSNHIAQWTRRVPELN